MQCKQCRFAIRTHEKNGRHRYYYQCDLDGHYETVHGYCKRGQLKIHETELRF